MNPNVHHLPGPDDGADGLLKLAEQFGDQQVFQLIRLCRTARGRGQDPAGEVLQLLANRMVETERHRRPVLSHTEACAAVADGLGYSKPTEGNGRATFYNILRGRGRTRRASQDRRTD